MFWVPRKEKGKIKKEERKKGRKRGIEQEGKRRGNMKDYVKTNQRIKSSEKKKIK